MPAWLWHAAAIAAQQACYAATCRVVMKGTCIYGRPAASTIIHTPARTRIDTVRTRIHNPPLENNAFIVYNIF